MGNSLNLNSTEQLIISLSGPDTVPSGKNPDLYPDYIKDNIDWNEFILKSQYQGVLPIVYKNLSNYPDDYIPKEIMERLKQEYNKISVNNLNKTKELINLQKIFNEKGIKAIFFKGPALSDELFSDITIRPFSDIDLIISEQEFGNVKNILIDEGYQSQFTFNKSYELLYITNWYYYNFTSVSRACNIDVHWATENKNLSLSVNYFDLYGETINKELSGSTVTTINNEFLLLILCQHGCKHMWNKLKWINDINNLAIKEEIDWDKVIKNAKIYNCFNMLITGLLISSLVFKTKIPGQLKAYCKKKKYINIAYDAINNLFKGKRKFSWYFHLSNETRYYMSTVDKLSDKIKLFFEPVKVTPLEWKLNLPLSLYFLYYLYRPYRLLKKKCFSN